MKKPFKKNKLCFSITSPLLLIALAASAGGMYIIKLRSDVPVKVLGKELSLLHQYMLVGLATFPLLWLAGAGSVVFWVLGKSSYRGSIFNFSLSISTLK